MQGLGAWSLFSEQRGTGRVSGSLTEMLAHLLQGCSHCELLFPSPCRAAQPVPALPWVPILHSPGASIAAPHSHTAQGPRRCCWEDLCGADSSLAQCGSLHTMGMGTAGPGSCLALEWQQQPPQAHSPRQAGLAAPEPGWHSCVCRRNFPLGKVVCIFTLIRFQRHAKGAREMKHVLSQPNRQINTGGKKPELF